MHECEILHRQIAIGAQTPTGVRTAGQPVFLRQRKRHPGWMASLLHYELTLTRVLNTALRRLFSFSGTSVN